MCVGVANFEPREKAGNWLNFMRESLFAQKQSRNACIVNRTSLLPLCDDESCQCSYSSIFVEAFVDVIVGIVVVEV